MQSDPTDGRDSTRSIRINTEILLFMQAITPILLGFYFVSPPDEPRIEEPDPERMVLEEESGLATLAGARRQIDDGKGGQCALSLFGELG
jgi:hypothetical protein